MTNNKDEKYNLIVLFGKAGAGKSFLQKFITDNFKDTTHKVVSCTTRPPREGEKDGVDYNFLSVEDFANQIINLSMLEATCFNDWHYGTQLSALKKDKINIGVFNVKGIECLLEDSRLNVVPIYVECPSKTRLIRQLSREDNPNCSEICRRFLADEKDFSNIPFSYISFKNEKEDDIKEIPNLLKALYSDKDNYIKEISNLLKSLYSGKIN